MTDWIICPKCGLRRLFSTDCGYCWQPPIEFLDAEKTEPIKMTMDVIEDTEPVIKRSYRHKGVCQGCMSPFLNRTPTCLNCGMPNPRFRLRTLTCKLCNTSFETQANRRFYCDTCIAKLDKQHAKDYRLRKRLLVPDSGVK